MVNSPSIEQSPQVPNRSGRVVVLGATGYIGARLVPRLAANGHRVVAVARSTGEIERWSWGDRIEAIEADLLEDDLTSVLRPGDTVVHLVHSLSADEFEERDEAIARNVIAAADECGVRRIVYLGGLGSDRSSSDHLDSRHAVGRVLHAGSTPVTELRAAMVLGSGSASFEMLRTIAELFPILPVPRSVRTTRCQPVAIDTALSDVEWAIDADDAHGVVHIGTSDVLTYEQIIQTYAEEAGLHRRRFVVLPLVPDWVITFVLGVVAPLPRPLVGTLVGSLGIDVVVDPARSIDRLRPDRDPSTIADAIRRALQADREPSSHWTDDLALNEPAALLPADSDWAGQTIFTDTRTVTSERSAAEIFSSVAAIGGRRGWLAAPLLWEIRGWIDRVVPGGVGLRRGRRHPFEIRLGDVVDWWRVEQLVADRHMLLRAEMRAPGDAWLEWRIDDRGSSRDVIQRAIFVPQGLAGRLYWWSLLPFHGYLFPRLLERIVDGVGVEGLEASHDRGVVERVAGDADLRDLRETIDVEPEV